MKYLLQIDFPYSGPFGSAFFDAMKELAEDIATENGLVYKLWTENEATQEAGGICFKDIKSKVFIINEALSAITKASL